jgi:prophage DNA circulation protein
MPFTFYSRLVQDPAVVNPGSVNYRPSINPHYAFSVIQLRVMGTITTQQAQDLISHNSNTNNGVGVGLDADELTQVQELVATVTQYSITGSTANEALGRSRRAARMDEILAVFTVLDQRPPLLDTVAEVEAVLGVPAH